MNDAARRGAVAVNPVSVVGGLLLLFFLPGFLLLHALFPGRRYFGPFHAAALPLLSLVTSVAILVVVGMVLGFLPGEPPGGAPGHGWFQGLQSGCGPAGATPATADVPCGEGRPVLEATLGGISLVLFAVAWWRGAFPLLGRSAEYDNVPERDEPEDVTLLRDLRLEEERLRKEALRIRKRASESRDPGVRKALGDAAEDLERDRRDVRMRAKEAQRRAGDRRYGAGSAAASWSRKSR